MNLRTFVWMHGQENHDPENIGMLYLIYGIVQNVVGILKNYETIYIPNKYIKIQNNTNKYKIIQLNRNKYKIIQINTKNYLP